MVDIIPIIGKYTNRKNGNIIKELKTYSGNEQLTKSSKAKHEYKFSGRSGLNLLNNKLNTTAIAYSIIKSLI